MARLNWSDAGDILSRCRIDRGADFHALPSGKVDALVAEGRAVAYRKPRNANGSYGRCFHAYLMRLIRNRPAAHLAREVLDAR
jgi:hypothetical protein